MTDAKESRWRKLCGWTRLRVASFGAAAMVLIGIASLCGFLAAWAWPFELLCHFRVQYSVLFVSLALVLGVCRAGRWAGVAILLAVVNGWEIVPYYVASPAAPHSGTPESGLRVVSANLFSGNREPQTAIEFLQQCDADVIALYEVTPEWDRRLRELLPDYPYQRVQPAAGNFGIGLYSRLPFVSAEFHPLSEENLALRAVLMHGGDEVSVIAAHTHPPGGRGTELRDRQLETLGKVAREVSGPLIIVGDLNITPFSPSFQTLCDTGEVREARRGAGILPTWPVGRPLLAIPIDHALSSGHWRRRIGTGPDIGSDHLPLLMDLHR